MKYNSLLDVLLSLVTLKPLESKRFTFKKMESCIFRRYAFLLN